MLRLAAAAVVASVALAPTVARACSVCGCGDPLVLAGDSMPVANTLRFALEYEYLTATARSDDEPDRTESLTQMTFRPVVVYSPVDRLNFVLQVPLVRKDWTLSASEAAPSENVIPTGLGDIDLGVRVFLWDATSISVMRRQNFALSAGTSFPSAGGSGPRTATTTSSGTRCSGARSWRSGSSSRSPSGLASTGATPPATARRASSRKTPAGWS